MCILSSKLFRKSISSVLSIMCSSFLCANQIKAEMSFEGLVDYKFNGTSSSPSFPKKISLNPGWEKNGLEQVEKLLQSLFKNDYCIWKFSESSNPDLVFYLVTDSLRNPFTLENEEQFENLSNEDRYKIKLSFNKTVKIGAPTNTPGDPITLYTMEQQGDKLGGSSYNILKIGTFDRTNFVENRTITPYCVKITKGEDESQANVAYPEFWNVGKKDSSWLKKLLVGLVVIGVATGIIVPVAVC